jgi:tRNA threonylcarbamoyladenosine biosynthesis protein TsaB
MKILALDTATEACSAALLVDGQLVATREAEFERGHAEHILPMIDAVLTEGGVALGAADAVAFGRGPGGFTGVRLAASVTQGLAFAANRPVVPISDLAAVAQRALDIEPTMDRVLVCNDARMQEVYWACFARDPQGLATLVGSEHVAPPETVELPPSWRASASDAVERASASDLTYSPAPAKGNVLPARAAPIGAIGRGFRAYPQLRSKLLSASPGGSGTDTPPVRLISDELLPRAHEIARLAVRELAAGRVVRPEEAIQVYLRGDVARPKPSQPASRN